MTDQPSPEDKNLTTLDAKIRAASQPKHGDGDALNPFVTDRQTTKASKIAYELLGAILVCLFFGWLADEQFNSTPWGVVIGLFGGFAVGVTNAYRTLSGVQQAVGWRSLADKPEINKADVTTKHTDR
jgi:ATP synthase protein I